ncbi:MAG: hypothetical protein QOD81_3445 [Solirubrobacteraceae bacterium]|jgi:hypothetical protein|nr:hypothetical protein [Solirubrobacteraceae bacterium]
MLRSVRRKVPWIVVFEAAMMMRARWRELPPHERTRLADLAKKSGGRPQRLTRDERAEFRRIAKGLDLFGVARDLAPFGRRMGRRH